MLWWTLRQLRSKDEAIQERAALELGRSRRPKAVDALLAALQDDGYRGTRFVIEGLAETGDERAVEALRSYLGNAQSYMHVGVVKAIGRIGGNKSREALIWALAEDSGCDYKARDSAAEALEQNGWTAADPALKLRCALIREDFPTLQRLGAAAVAPLLAMLRDGLWTKQAKAAATLGEIGDRTAIRHLVVAFTHFDDGVRRQAESALSKIDPAWMQSAEAISTVPDLVLRLVDGSRTVRESVELLLVRLGVDWEKTDAGSQAIPAFVKALFAMDAGVRSAAARVLRRLGWKPSTPEECEQLAIVTGDYSDLWSLGGVGVDPNELLEAFCAPSRRGKLSREEVRRMQSSDERRWQYAFQEMKKARDAGVIDPLLRLSFHRGFGSNPRDIEEVLLALVPVSELTQESIKLAMQAACAITPEESTSATRGLCAHPGAVTSNLLHLVSRKRDFYVSVSVGCSYYGGTEEERVSFGFVRSLALEELRRRGDPPYQPKAYLKSGTAS